MSVNPDTEPEITINPDTREIDIPTELYNIAVVADDNSEMVKLRIPRYFDGNDLSKRNCTISYNNAANKRGVYTVRNITIEEDTLLLHWYISKFVTVKAGIVNFVVEFKKEVDERGLSYSWSTLPAEINVMAGLDNKIEVDERDISLYQTLLSHIQANDYRLASTLESIYQLQVDVSLLKQQFEGIDFSSIALLENEVFVEE